MILFDYVLLRGDSKFLYYRKILLTVMVRVVKSKEVSYVGSISVDNEAVGHHSGSKPHYNCNGCSLDS